MLRMTEYVRQILSNKEAKGPSEGVTLIWNLTNLCNLSCKHCYSSANLMREEELETEEVWRLIPKLKDVGVRAVILSGGEPLLREDIFDIAEAIKYYGLKTYLSTNGLLVDERKIERIRSSFEYVGISIDGEPTLHDSFRGKKGAFERSMKALRLLMAGGVKVGLRFTLTEANYASLPFIFRLTEREAIPRIYISHLVYSGRGRALSRLPKELYLEAMEHLLQKVFYYIENKVSIEVVTGNNDADAVLLLREFGRRYPELSGMLYERLKQWGGNQAGVRLMNINFRGEVRPDPFFPTTLGNVREKDLEEIWNSNGLLSFLRQRPRRLKGRCGTCSYIDICNGNSRARAYAVYNDYLAEDPACYIS